jgi:hypothetical protein
MEMDYELKHRGMVAGIGMEQRGAYAPEAAQQRDTFGNVANDMETASERLQKLSAMLDAMADRISGPVPQQVGADSIKTDSPAHSLLDGMRRKQRSIGFSISRCEAAAERIANAMGS